MKTPLTSSEIREKALSLGWDDVGVTRASIPEADTAAYEVWIANGMHAGMQYMENPVRCDPQKLLPGAKTAILFVTNYKQEHVPFSNEGGVVASYARGRDYHHVHRKRLKKFIHWMEEKTSQKGIAKGFSDSSPILEKALAVQAGLGWFGKNTLLIHRQFGTFFLLSGVLTTIEIEDSRMEMRLARCGQCTRCIDACPTSALFAPYHLNASRCLSYHLIESKEEIPQEIAKKNPGYVFGCDICQDVCPHNQRKKMSEAADFNPERGMGPLLTAEGLDKLQEKPEALFGTPLQRRGVEGLAYNLSLLNRS